MRTTNSILRLAGNMPRVVDAVWARLAGVLALVLMLYGTVHAGMEQVWQYTVSTLPGQTFSTMAQAEAAMRGVSAEASLLQQSSESVTSASIARDYKVASVNPQKGEWAYPSLYAPKRIAAIFYEKCMKKGDTTF